MSEAVRIDLLELGRKIGVGEESVEYALPKPRTVTVQHWTKSDILEGIRRISVHKQAGNTVVFSGHAEDWVVVPLARSLMPECRVQYAAVDSKKLSPDRPPVTFDADIIELAMGEKNPALRFDYTLRQDGNHVYLDYSVDEPGVGFHTFDHDLAPELVLPPIPADCHLFIHAGASFYVQILVTYSYSRHVLSVSTACHDAPVYCCAASNCADISVGDETIRSPSAPQS